MSTAKEKADVVLIVIKRIVKWVVIAAAVFFGFVFLVHRAEEERHKERIELEDKVVVNAVVPDDKDCEVDYPYLYTVVNKTEKTVERVTFAVEIRRQGFSTPLNAFTQIAEDKILKPNEGYVRCFKAYSDTGGRNPVTEKNVDIKITNKIVYFYE